MDANTRKRCDAAISSLVYNDELDGDEISMEASCRKQLADEATVTGPYNTGGHVHVHNPYSLQGSTYDGQPSVTGCEPSDFGAFQRRCATYAMGMAMRE